MIWFDSITLDGHCIDKLWRWYVKVLCVSNFNSEFFFSLRSCSTYFQICRRAQCTRHPRHVLKLSPFQQHENTDLFSFRIGSTVLVAFVNNCILFTCISARHFLATTFCRSCTYTSVENALWTQCSVYRNKCRNSTAACALSTTLQSRQLLNVGFSMAAPILKLLLPVLSSSSSCSTKARWCTTKPCTANSSTITSVAPEAVEEPPKIPVSARYHYNYRQDN